MSATFDILSKLEVGHWIAIAFGCIGAVGVFYSVRNNRAALRERKESAREPGADVSVTINRKTYPGGWRSVQVHTRPELVAGQFDFGNWKILSVALTRPRHGVELARAKDDDYASGIFFPDDPVKLIEGKSENRPQRFALEFFIRFAGPDKGQRAQFKVAYSRTNGTRRTITKKWATVPDDAE